MRSTYAWIRSKKMACSRSFSLLHFARSRCFCFCVVMKLEVYIQSESEAQNPVKAHFLFMKCMRSHSTDDRNQSHSDASNQSPESKMHQFKQKRVKDQPQRYVLMHNWKPDEHPLCFIVITLTHSISCHFLLEKMFSISDSISIAFIFYYFIVRTHSIHFTPCACVCEIGLFVRCATHMSTFPSEIFSSLFVVVAAAVLHIVCFVTCTLEIALAGAIRKHAARKIARAQDSNTRTIKMKTEQMKTKKK